MDFIVGSMTPIKAVETRFDNLLNFFGREDNTPRLYGNQCMLVQTEGQILGTNLVNCNAKKRKKSSGWYTSIQTHQMSIS